MRMATIWAVGLAWLGCAACSEGAQSERVHAGPDGGLACRTTSAGEINDPNRVEIRRAVDGRIDGTQVHILSYLGERWGMGAPRFSAEQVVKWSQGIRQQGGAVTWDVPIQPNGLIAQPFIDQLAVLSKALRRP